MTLDRGKLAKIDRRILSGLDRDQRWQMVRVPASEAEWSAWKRYCDALGMSMGRAIAALVGRELLSVLGHQEGSSMSLTELKDRLDARQSELEVRERQVADRERWIREVELRMRAANPASTPRPGATTKVGRNDPCPCGSGVKYKRCHSR